VPGVRHSQYPEGRAGEARVVAPIVGGVNDYRPIEQLRRSVGAKRVDRAGPVRTEDARQADTGILAKGNPNIATIERRGAQAHADLAGTGFRRGDLVDTQLLGATELLEDECFHGMLPFGWVESRLWPSVRRRALMADLTFTFQQNVLTLLASIARATGTIHVHLPT
jgi:hypothetical protein